MLKICATVLQTTRKVCSVIKINRNFLLVLTGIALGFALGYWLVKRRAAWFEISAPEQPLWLPAQPISAKPISPVPSPPQPAPPEAPAKREPDDLTLIDGIGPAFARALGDLGITTFAQLAESNPDDLAARIDRLTAARIRRDDWVGQAKALDKS
jgi:predicted flap endonuclease-1-like 5' DNA nuclease